MKLFVALEILKTFLKHHPSTGWLNAHNQIPTVKVVNGAVECKVAVIQSLNTVLMTQEEQKQ
jgi:hypothetical protein